MHSCTSITEALDNGQISWKWAGFSALDRYYRGSSKSTAVDRISRFLPHEHIVVDADLPSLAACGVNLEFSGIEGIDAVVSQHDSGVMFISLDWDDPQEFSFPCTVPDESPLGCTRMTARNGNYRLSDTEYRILRERSYINQIRQMVYQGHLDLESGDQPDRLLAGLLSAAVLISRYTPRGEKRVNKSRKTGPTHNFQDYLYPDQLNAPPISEFAGDLSENERIGFWNALPPLQWRYYLELIFTGISAHLGLEFLGITGLISIFGPELLAMDETGHAKDHHPEGNVWRHTLETFRYRKDYDIPLAYALLLHDAGKPDAVPLGGRRFDGHAQLALGAAEAVCTRLSLPRNEADSVLWLVEHHMMPPALPRLQPGLSNRLMAAPQFPMLLELYRCDLSSSYSGPEDYYRICDFYNRYLKDRGRKRFRPHDAS